MSVRVAPCTWQVDYCTDAVTGTGCDALDSLSEERRDLIEDTAVEFLWNWTGKRYGLCEITVRPCRVDCAGFPSTYWGGYGPHTDGRYGFYTPVLVQGSWYNLGCGRCGDNCSCSTMDALLLPGPVDSIDSVIIDGTPLDPAGYRVDNSRYLVRQGGELWPVCQDMAAPSGTDGTWSVTYQRGIPVPAGGQVAAGVLACELAKAACEDSSCALPKRIQTFTRQGVSIAMLDSFDDLDQGHTGIWAIDSWVTSVTKSPRPYRVASPDYKGPRQRRTTWSG